MKGKKMGDGSGKPVADASRPELRCSYCGRFIAADMFDAGLAGMDFTPDSAYTAEKVEYFHNRCAKRHTTEMVAQ